MRRTYIRVFLMTIMLMLAINVSGQTACDRIFSSGVKCQQTMTVKSQKQAITYFKKAKACYDSNTKKNLCDQQIKACQNIINQLGKKSTGSSSRKTKEKNEEEDKPTPVEERQVKKRDIKLSLNELYVKFKGKGGEYKTVRIECNYNDWKISECPSWIKCKKNSDDAILISVERNPSKKEERVGNVTIKCGNKTVTLTVIQEKYKKFIII